jgi:aspartate/methionine/tyrosine aminotransferase
LQKGAVRLLRQERGFFEGIARHYQTKRDLLAEGLRAVGFRLTLPEGAYYLFADYREVPPLASLGPTEAAMRLIEHFGVASVPGDNFYGAGEHGAHRLRFAFCRGDETLAEGVRRLRRLAE